jgi:hypothetical protein
MEILIRVQVERVAGKFASRDSISEALAEAIQDIGELDGLGADGDSSYTIDDVEVV